MSIISNDNDNSQKDLPIQYSSNELNQLLSKVLQKVPNGKLSYLHVRTVENFILHFDSLLNKQKEQVFSKLQEYLNLLSNEDTISEYRRVDAMDCFDKFLLPLSIIYQDYLGFSLYPKFWVTLIWFMVILLLLLLFKAIFFFYLFTFIVFIAYYVKIIIQIKKRKVYGYFY